MPHAVPPDAVDRLRSLLLRTHVEANGLVAFLEHEAFSIAELDPDRLLADAHEKDRRFTRLALLAAEQEDVLKRCGYAPDRSGLHALFDEQPTVAATLGDVWRSIVGALEEARTLNDTNGRLIRDRRVYFESRLAALTAAARPTLLYGRDGQTDGALRGARSLDAHA